MNIRNLFLVLILMLFCAGLSIQAAGTNAEEADPIELRSGTLHGPEDSGGLTSSLLLSCDDLAKGGSALIKFNGPIPGSLHTVAESLGIRLVSPLGNSSWMVWLPEGGPELARQLPAFSWVAPYHPGLKIAPDLARIDGTGPGDRIPLMIEIASHADACVIADRLESIGLPAEGWQSGAGRSATLLEQAGRITVLATRVQINKFREQIANWP
ncbi:MAG: hypothetical protein ABFS86_13705, partial [Planctomycetota bacterium]